MKVDDYMFNETRSSNSPACTLLFIVLALMNTMCKHTTEPAPENVPDTTSHFILWRTDTIGYGSSVQDIAIVDENDIWAVGEFYFEDSTGVVDQTLYNVLRWDGTRWNPLRFYGTFGGTRYLRSAKAVIAFTANDLWVAFDVPRHWDGQTFHDVDLGDSQNGGVNRFWGTSSTNLYAVSTGGKFAHYDGSRFALIPTGVNSWFWDITGNGEQVYIGSYYYDNQIRPSGVFSYDKSQFRFLFPDAADTSSFRALRDAFGVWVSPAGTLWAVADPFVFKPLESHHPISGLNPLGYQLLCIRGLSDADVWVGGIWGYVLHFNGASWKQYTPSELHIPGVYAEYHTVAVRGNTVALGGLTFDPDYGIITVGRRVE